MNHLGGGGTTAVFIRVGNRNGLVTDAVPLSIHRVAVAGIGTVCAHSPDIITHILVSDQGQGVVGCRGGDTNILIVQCRGGNIINRNGLVGTRLTTRGRIRRLE